MQRNYLTSVAVNRTQKQRYQQLILHNFFPTFPPSIQETYRVVMIMEAGKQAGAGLSVPKGFRSDACTNSLNERKLPHKPYNYRQPVR